MTAILTQGNSEGERRCDARCHNATEPECTCICGGRYHGRGEAAAREELQRDVENGVFGPEIAAAARAVIAAGRQLTFEDLDLGTGAMGAPGVPPSAPDGPPPGASFAGRSSDPVGLIPRAEAGATPAPATTTNAGAATPKDDQRAAGAGPASALPAAEAGTAASATAAPPSGGTTRKVAARGGTDRTGPAAAGPPSAALPTGQRRCPCGRLAKWGSTKCSHCEPWATPAQLRAGR